MIDMAVPPALLLRDPTFIRLNHRFPSASDSADRISSRGATHTPTAMCTMVSKWIANPREIATAAIDSMMAAIVGWLVPVGRSLDNGVI
jgi:hypothetical protein